MAEQFLNVGMADGLKQRFREISQHQSKRFFVEDYCLMSRIFDPCVSIICRDVKFEDIKMELIPIFTPQQVEEAECGRGSHLQMLKICESVKRLSLEDFIKFIIAVSKDHRHVAHTIIERIQNFDVEKEFPQASSTQSQMPCFSKSAIAQECSSPVLCNTRTKSAIQTSAGSAASNIAMTYPNFVSKSNSSNCCRSPPGAVNSRNSQSSQSSGFSQLHSGPQESPMPLMSPSNRSLASSGSSSETFAGARARMLSLGSADNAERSVFHSSSHLQIHPVQGPQSSLDQVYDMATTPRGMVLIINNINFTHFSERRGSTEDATNLHNMFKYLGFHVCKVENKKAFEMLGLLKTFSKHQKLGSVSSLAVAILSHGGSNDSVFGTDGQMNGECPVEGTYITKMDIIQIFKGSACTAMEGKPKLFILQACRGSVENIAVPTQVPSGNSTTHRSGDANTRSGGPNQGQSSGIYGDDPFGRQDYRESGPQRSTGRSGDERFTVSSRPADTADMCFVHSSSYGHKAYRMRSKGSPFIQEFTKTVIAQALHMEFRDIVQEIQRHFNLSRLPNNMKTLPDFSLQLMKKWYLKPPMMKVDKLFNFG